MEVTSSRAWGVIGLVEGHIGSERRERSFGCHSGTFLVVIRVLLGISQDGKIVYFPELKYRDVAQRPREKNHIVGKEVCP